MENLARRLGSCETELGQTRSEQVTVSQMLDKAKAEVASLQTQVEATHQQLRLKDREHEEQGRELTVCKEELAKCKARL